MEVYRNDTAEIKLPLPINVTTHDVSAYIDGVAVYTWPDIVHNTSAGYYSVTLPFSLVDQDREFDIRWTLGYVENVTVKSYSHTTHIKVVTPYVTLDEIKDALGAGVENYTDAELLRTERRIRGVIDSVTGQTFGRFTATLNIQATGDEDLILPNRLIKFTSVTGADYQDGSYFATRGDGWYLSSATPFPNSDWPGYVWDGVIRDPRFQSNQSSLWKDNQWYAVTGDWGYEDVPTDIKEAVLILIEDNLCPDSEYRDRYIALVKTADFTYQYQDTKAWNGTGSAIADMLLAPYIRSNYVVI